MQPSEKLGVCKVSLGGAQLPATQALLVSPATPTRIACRSRGAQHLQACAVGADLHLSCCQCMSFLYMSIYQVDIFTTPLATSA